ncbi:hypothetical protein GQ600_11932 [Phytophthora cactorum]|nr:hypothetical protein GQ600_11932 [Phytophthora cactorum]
MFADRENERNNVDKTDRMCPGCNAMAKPAVVQSTFIASAKSVFPPRLRAVVAIVVPARGRLRLVLRETPASRVLSLEDEDVKSLPSSLPSSLSKVPDALSLDSRSLKPLPSLESRSPKSLLLNKSTYSEPLMSLPDSLDPDVEVLDDVFFFFFLVSFFLASVEELSLLDSLSSKESNTSANSPVSQITTAQRTEQGVQLTTA